MKSLSDPRSKVQKKIPFLKLKWFQILPSIKIHVKGKIFHLHHWMHFSIIFLISVIVNNGVLSLPVTKGLLLGGIIQGLTFTDWKRIISQKR